MSEQKLTQSEYKQSTFTEHRLQINRDVTRLLDYFPGPRTRLTLEEIYNPVINEMILELHTWLLSKKHIEKQVTEHLYIPSSVWQHFKRDYMPEWFLKRFPVDYHTENIINETRTINICPHDTEAWSDDKALHIVWMEKNQREENLTNSPLI